jgi:hypothetical protein
VNRKVLVGIFLARVSGMALVEGKVGIVTGAGQGLGRSMLIASVRALTSSVSANSRTAANFSSPDYCRYMTGQLPAADGFLTSRF